MTSFLHFVSYMTPYISKFQLWTGCKVPYTAQFPLRVGCVVPYMLQFPLRSSCVVPYIASVSLLCNETLIKQCFTNKLYLITGLYINVFRPMRIWCLCQGSDNAELMKYFVESACSVSIHGDSCTASYIGSCLLWTLVWSLTLLVNHHLVNCILVPHSWLPILGQ